MMPLIVESVLRSLLMAAMVWLGIRLFRISNALAQKMAWSLVLIVAFAMPLLMRWQTAHPHAALTIPVRHTTVLSEAVSNVKQHIYAVKLQEPETTAPLPTLSSTVILPQVSPLVSMDRQPVRITPWKLSTFVPYLVPAYLAVCGALLLRLLIGLALAVRLWNRAEPASPMLEPRATVRISSAIQSPVNIGSGIVLPASYTEWDRAKLQLVLAHERAHVRQGDFYLQLAASIYAALIWFSPLGWYLKHTLADLGEALSDRAALDETGDHSGYAEVLLEFASVPRKGLVQVMAGVGMARSSNLTRRIERILNDTRFRRAFQHGRRHVAIAALLIPCGLLLATALFHVQAAEVVKAHALAVLQQAPASVPEPIPSVVPDSMPSVVPDSTRVSPVASATSAAPIPEPSPSPDKGQEFPTPPTPPTPPSAPEIDTPDFAQSGQTNIDVDSHSDNRGFAIGVNDDVGAFVILDNTGKSSVSIGSRYDDEIARMRSQAHGPFLWCRRDGKSYLITDPALVMQAKAVFGPQGELGRKQQELGRLQGELGRQQGELARQQALAHVSMPDISAQLAEAQKAVDALAADKAQELTQARLSEVQARLGEVQGRLAEAQALAASKQVGLGAQQGNLGEKQAELGRKQAELGREQARIGREASQKVWSMIDQAVRDGKAKPVE